MIKLVFNRFVQMEPIEENLVFKSDTKGLKDAQKEATKTKSTLSQLNKTGIILNTTSIDNAIKKVSYFKTLLKTLKENSNINIKSNIAELKGNKTFKTLPKSMRNMMTNLGSMEGMVKNDETYNKVIKSLTDLEEIFSKVNDETEENTKEMEANSKSTKNADNSFKGLLKQLKEAPGLVDTVSDKFRNLDFTKLVFLWYSIRRVTRGLVEVVENAADYEESLNLYTMALGKFANQATVWSNNITEKLKLDPSDVMKYTGAFYNLVKGMNVGATDAYIMSKNLTQLTYDMASYLNISNEAAQAKIQSAMAGQSRAVASVGVAMQVASLQELAYSMGIKKSVKEMTQAEKTYLRYIQLMNSTKQMQGDLGRTMITPANAIRTLRNQLNLLSRAIGQVLTPMIMEAIPYIMAFTNVLTRAASALANFFGYKIADVDYSSAISFEDAAVGADNLGKLGSAASKAGKQVSESLAPFDELNNVISENDKAGSYGGSGGVSSSIDPSTWKSILPEYDMLKDYSDELVKRAKDLEGSATAIAAIIASIVGGAMLGKMVISAVQLAEAFGKVNTFALKFLTNLGMSNSSATALLGTLGKIGIAAAGAAAAIGGLALESDAIKNVANDTEVMSTTKAAIAGGLTAGGGAAVGGMIGGPVGAVVGGIVGYSAFLINAIKGMEEADQKAIENVTLKITDFKREFAETKKTIDLFNSSYGESMSLIYQTAEAKLKDLTYYDNLRNRLAEITDSQGNVLAGHKNEAKFIVSELNTALGTNIELRNGKIKNYDKEIKSIDKLMEKMKAEIKLEAMQSAYKEAILKEKEAMDSLSDAIAKKSKADEMAKKSLREFGYVTEEVKKEVEDADRQYQDTAKHVQETIANKQRYEEAYGEFLKGHYDKVNEIYDNSSKEQFSTFKDTILKMTNELKPGSELSEDLLNQWKTMATTDKDAFNQALLGIGDEETKNKIIAAIGEWRPDLLDYMTLLGEDSADDYVKGAQVELDENELKPKVEIEEGKKKELVKSLNKYFKDNNVNIDITAKDSPSQIFEKFKKYFLKNPFKVALDLAQGKLSGILGSLKITGFASGGYPTSGDLFFANENGVPEYITSVGNKSAVVNQAQMIQTLTNAITAGFQQFGGAGASNVTVYVGDKKLYQGQGEYQTRQNDRYGTTVVRI